MSTPWYEFSFEAWAKIVAIEHGDACDAVSAEMRSQPLEWLSESFRLHGNGSAAFVLKILHLAQYSGHGEQLAEGLLRWAIDAGAKMRLLRQFAEGLCPPSPEVLEAILWCQSAEDRAGLASMPYDDYLQTPFWKCVRALVLARDGNQCRNCTATTRLHVHHRTYEHRGREHEHLDDLTVLCADCHAKFHEVSP